MSLVRMFIGGGVFMWPILFCSVASIAIIIYEGVLLYRFHKGTGGFFDFLSSHGKSGSPSFVSLGKEELLHPDKRALKVIEDRVQLSFDRVGKPLELVSAFGNLAPLLGFLGTVSGMISSFASIANADKVSVKLVAAGISEALITTGFGLIVAAICMLFESIFRYYLAKRAHDASENMDEFLEGAAE